MSVRNLRFLFRPESLAVIGASERPGSPGAIVTRNVLDAGFPGPVWLVNPKHPAVCGRPAFPDVAALPTVPDLAVVCTPPESVPGIIAGLGARGTRAAVVMTGGLPRAGAGDGRPAAAAMLEAARPHVLRVLGPNCVGLLVPEIGLNASFAHGRALPGTIAFVSQSGALAAGMLDWAATRGVGFSHFVALGDGADVDFGDVLDYLGSDPGTRSILLYIETLTDARKFMSAARAAARNKPVIAVRAGRVPEGARAAAFHTGALAGADDVYDAALARAGIVRVATTTELFDAAETLARAKPLRGNRLAILTNGGGPGVMATDALIAGGGRLASFSEATLRALDGLLPATRAHGNPVNVMGDAPASRYAAVLGTLLADPDTDAVLLIHVPTAIVPSVEIARACVPLLRGARRNVFSCWLGGDSVREADALLNVAGSPTYATPEDAVRGFLQLVNHRRGQELLMETPPSIPLEFKPDTATARRLIDGALADGRDLLTEPEAERLLAAYGIPVVETRAARDAEDAMRMAREIGGPVALKILSPDIAHKSDVGGVALDLASPEDVRAAAEAMVARCAALRPRAKLAGFAVQRMVHAGGAHELIVGVATDEIFGPVILFGQGGTGVEIVADKAIALPPLNLALARELVSRTRVSRLLDGYRDRPATDRDALHLALVKVSQLVADLPGIVELDINPLLAHADGVIALDVRARVARPGAAGARPLAIRPYPGELEERIAFDGGEVLLRPIRPEDEPQHRALLARISTDDIQSRFFHAKREFARSELARFTQIDYDREMAFIATRPDRSGLPETLGVARAIADPDNTFAEFAVLVRSDLKGKGLGRVLLDRVIRYCRDRGTRQLTGEVLAANSRMLKLVAGLGFRTRMSPEDPGIVRATLELQHAAAGTSTVP